MNVISFDQSTTCSGWSLFVDGKYVKSGFVDKHKMKDADKRIAEMGLALCRIIKEYKPDVVTIENIQNQSNVKAVIYLARLQGCIILYCASKGIKLNILSPTQWRSSLSYNQGPKVKREELKQQSRDFVKNNFGLDIESEDEIEAIAINEATHRIYELRMNDDESSANNSK